MLHTHFISPHDSAAQDVIIDARKDAGEAVKIRAGVGAYRGPKPSGFNGKPGGREFRGRTLTFETYIFL